jgi:hypothetical protein
MPNPDAGVGFAALAAPCAVGTGSDASGIPGSALVAAVPRDVPARPVTPLPIAADAGGVEGDSPEAANVEAA